METAVEVALDLRRALALPVYTIALLLDYLSTALGRLAAWIAGDPPLASRRLRRALDGILDVLLIVVVLVFGCSSTFPD